MTSLTRHSAATELIADFVSAESRLTDRADLARFLRGHQLIAEGAVPITLADLDEAITLRDGIRLVLARGLHSDPEAAARAQRVLDGLRVTVRLEHEDETSTPLAPAVVDEVRRGLARVAAAWAALLITGEWRRLRTEREEG